MYVRNLYFVCLIEFVESYKQHIATLLLLPVPLQQVFYERTGTRVEPLTQTFRKPAGQLSHMKQFRHPLRDSNIQ